MEFAHFGSTTWSDPLEVTHDPGDLERGCWAVVVTFEGELTAVRFGRRHEGGAPPGDARRWPGANGWRPSLDAKGYVEGVEEIRRRIAAGTVYQVNLTTVLSAPMPGPQEALAAVARAAGAGVRIGCFRPPSTPDGVSRLRLTAHAGLSEADLEHATAVLRTLRA